MTRILSIFFILLTATAYSSEKTKLKLGKFEKKVYSQNGEDGVLLKIFDVIGTKSKFFVEFGVQDGVECNTRLLREQHGWNGLMMDCGFYDPQINLMQERITAENINALFDKHGVPSEFDLLSIDIDYNDFYVWKAIEKRFSPRVVVIEFNSKFPPNEDKIVVYDSERMWDQTCYHGASILALYRLGREKGYSLVHCDKNGVNLFFIRDDILEKLPVRFRHVNQVDRIYQKPSWWHGHSPDPQNRPWVSSLELE